ncbi:DUF6443 domain-containing protein [Chryseobacterium sp. AG363]|uniref:DUF6443 domain-containing protein n=1 Tax=Chryseobacterium sp. AG363 TaxID=2183997 RepID=UPI000E76A4BD|nr:DUF6443 domain-containing protein [Chryseobacterium sp. AG363]
MKKLIILSTIMLGLGISHAQNLTPAENYVYSKTYLSEDGSKKAESVQYFDGLGRLKQTISVKSSPTGKDLVVPVYYDELGRQTKNFLPLPMATTNSGIQTPVEADINSYYGVSNAYSEKIFDNSPLGRVIETAAPGDTWKKGSGHTIKSDYETNIPADRVKKYTITSSWANTVSSFSIPAVEWFTGNQLMKMVTTDEDGNKSILFKNSQGQTILARKMNGSVPIDTYYIYNIYNQLVLVIPPKADKEIAENGDTVTQAILDKLCYQYKYDNRGRQVEKRLPGKNYWEYFVYDKQNRLVLSQDANQHLKQWSFVKYDQLGRVVYTGLLANTSDRITMQNALNNMANNAMNNESRTSTPFVSGGLNIYYTNNAFPTASISVLTVNYYDEYAPGAPQKPATILGKSTLGATPALFTSDGVSSYRSIKGMLTSSYVKNIEDNGWSQSYIWYNAEARPIGTHSINHLGGYTKTESELDFAGVVKQTKVYHKRLNTDTEKVITQTFEYDAQNRLLVHKHQVDNNPVEILSQNSYNDLSQLKAKKVGGTNLASPLQTIDYTYNIRGWMTGINDPGNLGNDLFGYKINYNTVEGLQIPNAAYPDLKVTPRYNGNVAEVSWKTLTQENEPLKRYGYSYDPLNRMTAGFYQKAGKETAGEYFEKIDYDINGNIERLKRSEEALNGNTFATVIDNLRYEYTGNKLTKVTDEQQNPSGYPYLVTPNTISYDDNGNMKDHLDKGISAIQYNYLNLPQQITQNAKVTQYTYRADGVKVKKLFGDLETDYLDGFQYKSTFQKESWNGEGIFQQDPNEVPVVKLRIIPTSEGYYDALLNQYVYQFKDHLGNIRLSYTDTNKDGIIQPRQYSVRECIGKFGCIDNWKPGEIIETNTYYPFGLLHNYTATTQNAYQYKYNGKELQETGMYDYGARMYMSDLGRWGVVDPLAESYRRFSPYHYAMNNPINFIDPDGMGSYNSEGRWVSEMEGFYNYHHMSDQYRPKSFKTGGFGEGNGGGGYIPFGKTKAYADLMDSFQNGGTFGLTNSNGVMKWWTDISDSYDEEGNRVKTIGAFGILKFKNYSVDNIDWNYTGSTFWNAAKLTANMADFAYSRMADYHFYDGPWMKRGWRNANGVWNDATVLARQANGRFVRGVAGKRIAAANAKAFAGSLGSIAKKASVIGYAMDGYEIIKDGKVTVGEATKMSINLIAGSIGPVGWAWMVADIGVALFNNGTGLNDIIASEIDNVTGGAAINVNPF